jgi:hypothetical protein
MAGDFMSKKENNPYVTQGFCNERFNRVMDGITAINKKLDEIKEDRKESSHFWRNFIAGIASGLILVGIGYGISCLPGV